MHKLSTHLLLIGFIAFATMASAQEAGETFTLENQDIEFQWCPPGTGNIGSKLDPGTVAGNYGGNASWFSHEKPQQELEFAQGFWIGKLEITQAQWKSVMDTTPWKSFNVQDCDECPATGMGYAEAEAFVEKLSEETGRTLRLPTEDEWAYASRAATDSDFYFGDDPKLLPEHAWTRAETDTLKPGGTKKPNAWGIHDILGNAAEWTTSTYSDAKIAVSQLSLGGYRVVRGGSIKATPAALRNASRVALREASRKPTLGLRILLEQE